ncbi:MAG: acyl carrier protein [Desulfosarcina sp.]|nr:acyl carrier protein [Desulfosarcina sp.]MBC2744900.1 acyl carrier protein [Desulfosarcina sp.]MBC2767808.1 acyl carrier protein [Desulfosarcina sp.]
MTEAEIKETIFRILAEIAPEADFEVLSPDENLRKALDIDSYDALKFIIGLNEELGVDIPESDYGQLNTLTTIIRYLSTRVG